MPIFILSLEFRSSPPLAPPSLQNQNSKSTSKDDSLGTSSGGGGGFNRIKMRSGPLPYESLFGFSGDKGPILA
ncbi:hypothetical protein D8674_026177 [Pyrus ussuriensis x Pyrus communis]|uniref:Uncharacterized protein n=1 Tax=Pyrus ussuriensis x Pyrus communis TaxID=2448454 RepID=A0A5N5I979_9ROSA|nr:hypothetical protein D8674_026177 [Pyrus ussuriensis x Pyrus communis]